MSSVPVRRSVLDRLMKPAVPRPVTDFAPAPRELAPGLWALDRQLRFPGGARLPSRTTVVRLSDGALVVISPPPLVGWSAAAIDSLGTIKQVIAPSTSHYVFAREFMARYPEARLLVAPGLLERVPDLPPSEELGASGPEAWSGVLDIAVLGPVRGFSEVLFFHVPTGTLILTDLAFNLTRFPRFFDRLAWRLTTVPDGFRPSRTARLLLLRDRKEASRCLSRVSGWPIRRIVVAHGDVIEHDARAQFLRCFAGHL